MSEQKQMIENTIGELQKVIDLFYQQKKGKALKKMDAVLGKLVEAIDTLFAYQTQHPDFPLNQKKMTDSLTEALGALQEGDHVLLADILQYDFLEYLQELVKQMQ